MHDIEQRTDEWFAARCGKLTASRLADALARTKTGWGASRANYAAQLVAERLTGTVEAGYSNAAMAWGTEKEPDARAAYAFSADVDVAEIGFVDHPTIPMAGASPDGLIGDDGMVEIKCPGTAKHIATLIGGVIDDKYVKQMQWQMACTGRKWCDFVSYDPRMPVEMQLFVKRIERDDAAIAEWEAEASAFLAEVEQTVATLSAQYQREAA
jgi:putative phage-type endonuclease